MKIIDLLKNNPVNKFIARYWIVIISILIIPSYIHARNVMTSQIVEWEAVLSNFTVNFILFLGLFGWLIGDLTKKMPKWKGWLIWGLATGTLFLLLKLAGFDNLYG